MNLWNHARTLMMAGIVAASVVGASTVNVSAQRPWHDTKSTCEADGYLWDGVRGCADEYCNDGLMGYGDPGETQVWQGHIYMCDGFTGQWTVFARAITPTFPIVPTVGNVQVSQPTPTGPFAPLPIRGVFGR